MSIPAFLNFIPVPVRARHDGWTPDRQLRFVIAIARGAGPSEAAREVGRSRQTAHALRRHEAGGDFARAWDEAAVFADRAAQARRTLRPTPHGLETVWEPRFRRGRLVGFVVREDHAGALRTLAALDRAADRLARAAGAKAAETDGKHA